MALFKINEKKRTLVTIVSIVMVILSLISIYYTQRPKVAKINLTPYEAMGFVMGEETSKLLGGKGKVAIVYMKSSHYKMPDVDSQLKGLHAAFKEVPEVTIVGEETVEPELLGEVGADEVLPGEMFSEVLNKHPDMDALISFIGAPGLTDEQLKGFESKPLKVVTFAVPSLGLKQLLENDLVQVAVVRKEDQTPSGKAENLQDSFNQFWVVITKQNADLIGP